MGSDENLGFVAFDFCFCGFLVLVKMMVANSFDLWKKDVFFPAAEEVQESADMYVPFCLSLVLIMWVLAVLISFCVYFDFVFQIWRWVFKFWF